MNSDRTVVLDACVLLPMPLVDTLLRLAEHPRLYLPKWTDDIMAEVSRNLIGKLNKTQAQALRREAMMREAFPESWVEGYELLIEAMANHPKDRHVLAAAVRSGSELIVTYNKKDFSPEALKPWAINVCGPSAFLKDLYGLAPGLVQRKIDEQASDLGISFERLLQKLNPSAPAFVDFLSHELGIELRPSA